MTTTMPQNTHSAEGENTEPATASNVPPYCAASRGSTNNANGVKAQCTAHANEMIEPTVESLTPNEDVPNPFAEAIDILDTSH